METKRTYFPGLNALRFVAATLVIFHHLEQYKSWSQKGSFWGNTLIDAMGHKPVGLFFVLSGFLITYLLLEENKRNHTINIPLFYLKRVLRIWPLYFVIVFAALIIVPLFSEVSFSSLPSPQGVVVWLPLLLILPNLLRISFPTMIGANQLWSVGIEEQFYLFWPLLVKRFQNNIIRFLWLFILIKVVIHLLLLTVLQVSALSWLAKIENLYKLFPVEQMAVGALGAAYLFHKRERMILFMGSPIVAIVAIIFIIATSFMHINFFLFPFIEAVFFIVVIYQITINNTIHKYLENGVFNYLGSISYGIYMWHTLAIALSITLLDLLNWNRDILLILLSLSVTFSLSYLSFRFLENPIQGLRKYSFSFRVPFKNYRLTNAK